MIYVTRLPQGETPFEDYSISINGEKAQAHCARVSAMPYNTVWPGRQRPLDQTEIAPFLIIEADESFRVTVDYSFAPEEVIVRPLSRDVKAQIDGQRAELTIPGPGQYTVEADGFHQALHLFVDAPRDWDVREGDPNVIYFGPGAHHPGVVSLRSGQTAYVDRDAVVYGAFEAVGQHDVRVCGHGIIDGSFENRVTGDNFYLVDPTRTLPDLDEAGVREMLKAQRVLKAGLKFWSCRRVSVEGCVIRDTDTFALIPGGCDGVMIDAVKTIGMWRYNSDGIDLINTSHAVIRNCFLRDFDDCIVIKGAVGYDAGLSNAAISVEGCVIWCDWGRALEIGAETNAPEYRDIVFRDCDVIHGSTINLDIQHHNHAMIHDILFEDIRVEYTRHQLSDVYQHDMTAPYAPPAPVKHPVPVGIYILGSGLFNDVDYRNGSVRNVIFRDIAITTEAGVPDPVTELVGLDEAHMIEGVIIENMTINGRRAERGDIAANACARGIEVR